MGSATNRISDEQIIQAFKDVKEPFATAPEISESVGMTRQGVHNRLQDLHDSGELGRKEVGSRAVVWWVKAD